MRTCFFFQAEDGIRDVAVTGVQTCALPILRPGIWKGSPSKHEPEDRRAPAGRALRLLQARQRLAAAVRRAPGELEDRVRRDDRKLRRPAAAPPVRPGRDPG